VLNPRFSVAFSIVLASFWFTASSYNAAVAADLAVDVLYIEQRIERPPVLSNLVAWPDDDGERGATLGTDDNDSTGRFLGQTHTLDTLIIDVGEDVLTPVRDALNNQARLVVLNVDADTLLAIADMPEAADDLLFNARSLDVALRDDACRANVLHTAPSRLMLSDALMQFLNKRKWREVFMIEGNRAGDVAMGNAMRRSAKKFRLEIVQDKKWIEDADMRRNAAQEVPLFTQARKYDGFNKLANRDMTETDYANWAAVRSIGEAVTRINTVEPSAIKEYLLSPDFELGGFKGASLSYRSWNGQLRQSIQLVHANAVVASAPLEGFLHARTELDSLGLDEPESGCDVFQ